MKRRQRNVKMFKGTLGQRFTSLNFLQITINTNFTDLSHKNSYFETTLTAVTEEYKVVTFKAINGTQSQPSIQNLGRQYILVIIYCMDVPCTVCEGPLLRKFSLKLNSEGTINITILYILKNKRSKPNALMKKVGIEEK